MGAWDSRCWWESLLLRQDQPAEETSRPVEGAGWNSQVLSLCSFQTQELTGDSMVNSSTWALLLKRTCQDSLALTGFGGLLSLIHLYYLCLPFQHQSSFSLSCCPFANVPWPHPTGLPSHPCSSPFSDSGRWKEVRPLPPTSSPLTSWRPCFQHTLFLTRPPSHRWSVQPCLCPPLQVPSSCLHLPLAEQHRPCLWVWKRTGDNRPRATAQASKGLLRLTF